MELGDIFGIAQIRKRSARAREKVFVDTLTENKGGRRGGEWREKAIFVDVFALRDWRCEKIGGASRGGTLRSQGGGGEANGSQLAGRNRRDSKIGGEPAFRPGDKNGRERLGKHSRSHVAFQAGAEGKGRGHLHRASGRRKGKPKATQI